MLPANFVAVESGATAAVLSSGELQPGTLHTDTVQKIEVKLRAPGPAVPQPVSLQMDTIQEPESESRDPASTVPYV